MIAVYVSNNQFKVENNLVSEFRIGRRIKANCGVDGYTYSTVLSSSYSDSYTTVTITENVLTSNLIDVVYGIINVGPEGSLPNHIHDNAEGQGGPLSISLIDLDDTPTTYSGSVGNYLRVTASGIEFVDMPSQQLDYVESNFYANDLVQEWNLSNGGLDQTFIWDGDVDDVVVPFLAILFFY
jgi:hypothetical protein